MTILGLRFSGYPVSINFMDFNVSSELLGNRYTLIWVTRRYFGPTNEPQIHIEWLRVSMPLGVKLDDIPLKRFLFYFISSCLFDNNRSMLDWGSLSYGFFITFVR